MNRNTNELLSRGMKCLTDSLGIVDAEQFISIIKYEKFDYTKWQREYFDTFAPGEFIQNALTYSETHPYEGNADIL
ncbi:MAG: hypothetical protein IJI45_00520 [Anaerolineaceae bacterium]|nr:hypothetical protein [Anaerolineaceae bacterium]